MAFVDGESERVLQEASVLLGRCVIMRGGIKKAVEYLMEQRSPQLLIVDISGVDLPLSKIHELAEVSEPGTNVVAIGDHNDVGLYRDLQEAGVSQYILKPLTRELLQKALNPKAGHDIGGNATLKLGKILSFIGARGGVGTTTLAANMAWHLANKQARRVALVDLDLQHGDSGMLFKVKQTPGFREALSNPLRLDALLLDRIMTQVSDRLFVLGSEESLTDNAQFSPSAIDKLYSVLRAQFHYVIVDIPRIATPAYRRALGMVDRQIVVVDPTMRSMRDAVRIARLFEDDDTEAAGRPIDHRHIFVVNRLGEAGQYDLSMQEIKKVLQTEPVSIVPFLPKVIMPMALDGLMAASKGGKFSDAIGKLATELTGRQQQRRRFWQRKK
jgi:pilus assembly protein CpaE